jgi:hypothetical protein
MFMESPFYFELTLKERLFLLLDHIRRFEPSEVTEASYARLLHRIL